MNPNPLDRNSLLYHLNHHRGLNFGRINFNDLALYKLKIRIQFLQLNFNLSSISAVSNFFVRQFDTSSSFLGNYVRSFLKKTSQFQLIWKTLLIDWIKFYFAFKHCKFDKSSHLGWYYFVHNIKYLQILFLSAIL